MIMLAERLRNQKNFFEMNKQNLNKQNFSTANISFKTNSTKSFKKRNEQIYML